MCLYMQHTWHTVGTKGMLPYPTSSIFGAMNVLGPSKQYFQLLLGNRPHVPSLWGFREGAII